MVPVEDTDHCQMNRALMTFVAIARRLGALGVKTLNETRGGTRWIRVSGMWSLCTVRSSLTNETYAGALWAWCERLKGMETLSSIEGEEAGRIVRAMSERKATAPERQSYKALRANSAIRMTIIMPNWAQSVIGRRARSQSDQWVDFRTF
jgi:hypothetical protein